MVGARFALVAVVAFALIAQPSPASAQLDGQLGSLEIELRTAKLESGNRFDPSELEEMQMQSARINEMRLQTLKAQFQDENQQLRDVIVQLETHIN